MVFSRAQRLDRRRRMVRESAASDAAVAADYVRAYKKPRKSFSNDHDDFLYGVETPDYSQDVRKPCQQRVVQWIPVRGRSVWTLVGVSWLIWGLLLAAHYLLHTNANSLGRSPIPVLQLLDLRSPHSIANWMTCQLWLLTAAASWMVYRIRQYRLDDFSATYRVWFVMIGLALFSCFDTATSSTYLLGQSIDPWTRREIGYGGWPLLLAAYASLVALVGLKLSNEMRLSKSALWLWLGGLMAWGCAALLGTGLLKLQWSPGTIDLIVGGCWLGGVLAVFQAVGLVLRRCYMQAQRRFLERTALSKPKMDWEFQEDPSQKDSTEETDQDHEAKKKPWLPWRRRSDHAHESLEQPDDHDALIEQPPKRPMRLFGLFPHRSERNEQLAGCEPLRVEDQVPVDQGLTKKPKWFSKTGGSSKANLATAAARANELEPKRPWPSSWIRQKPKDPGASHSPGAKSAVPKSDPKESKSEVTPTQAPTPKKSWFSMGKKKSDATNAGSKSHGNNLESIKSKEPDTVESFEVLEEESPKSGKLAKRLFGWFDGLKLKPPKDNPDTAAMSSSKTDVAKSTSPATPIAPSSPIQPQQPRAEYDEEGDQEYEDYRHLSKAERKRLRRQQNDRGAA